jgi:hypothetical protein
MATTNEAQPGQRIDLTREVVGIDRTDRRAALVNRTERDARRISQREARP